MNGCPCGFFTDPKRECHCTPHQIQRYMSKISGPLLDRIDLHLEVPALPSVDLLSNHQAEASEMIKERILKVRFKQQERFAGIMTTANGHMNHRQIKKHCGLTDEGKKLLKAAIDELGLSARAHDRVLRVAR